MEAVPLSGTFVVPEKLQAPGRGIWIDVIETAQMRLHLARQPRLLLLQAHL
jgi:hypothetical protein